MLAHPCKAKEHDDRAEGRPLELVKVTTMSPDLPTECPSRTTLDQQQQQRQAAALYLPARNLPYATPTQELVLAFEDRRLHRL
ncbi:hypothetical protein IW152_002137 [Coemansia sp. BCRC 34962]|nr:hypothetical protein IW152_002137 [Coemansia sp. BCRC 34962]